MQDEIAEKKAIKPELSKDNKSHANDLEVSEWQCRVRSLTITDSTSALQGMVVSAVIIDADDCDGRHDGT